MSGPSPEAFVKALKSSNDVELAVSAWKNPDLYIPSKGQFIASWALNRLLKHTDSLLDFRIWNLLDSILLVNFPSTPQWLPTLLHKIPVVPILTSLIRTIPSKSSEEVRLETLRSCERILGVLLPLSYSKTRFETILESFWTSLEALSQNKNVGMLENLVEMAVHGFRSSFSNATNKAKVCSRYNCTYIHILTAIIDIYNVCRCSPSILDPFCP